MTLTGILLAIVPLVLVMGANVLHHFGWSPAPPAWAWDTAWTTLATGLAVAGVGVNRRDVAARGSFRDLRRKGGPVAIALFMAAGCAGHSFQLQRPTCSPVVSEAGVAYCCEASATLEGRVRYQEQHVRLTLAGQVRGCALLEAASAEIPAVEEAPPSGHSTPAESGTEPH